MQGNRERRLAVAALVGGAVAIAFAPIFVRLSVLGPSATAAHRVLLALPVMWLALGAEGWRGKPVRRPATRREFGFLALSGLLFALDIGFWHWSIRLTSVANATLLANFAPLVVALGAMMVLGERLTRKFWLALILALSGAVLLMWPHLGLEGDRWKGDLLALVTAIFYGGYQLSLKGLRRAFTPMTLMAWSGLVAGPLLAGVAWVSREGMDPVVARGWWVLLGLAWVSHVGGQGLIAYGFGHLPASISSISLLIQPVVAAGVAAVLFSEYPVMIQVIGGVIVLVGIFLATRSGVRERAG